MERNVVFNPKTYYLGNILNDIETGNIALPDLQRPFVWKLTKVRDLMDSIYKGLPIGSIVLWEIYEPERYKTIGVINNQRRPRFLVIDGQQRLTSLFSIVKNAEIVSQNVKRLKIKIAFNPVEEKFEVWNPAIEKSPEWIPDISSLFSEGSSYFIIQKYLEKIKTKPDIDENVIAKRIEKVKNIPNNYILSVIELSTDLDPEEVSEIFVRINSKGQSLNQSDFILTLMSVYWPEGRDELENFCKESYIAPANKNASSYNLISIKPTPANLIRTIVGYSFNRGRLKYAYLTLKGRDFENKIISEELRERNFEIFKDGQKIALNLSNWHDFIKIIHGAGFVNEKMISSKVTFYITYTLYLLGNYRYSLPHKLLESLIRRWFVFLQLTTRYTGSPETVIEEDLKTLEETGNIEKFVETRLNTYLTRDFWEINLPSALESSSTTNYAFQVYNAALVYFDLSVLFSNIKLRDYLNPFITQPKKPVDLHHLFPKEYLKKLGYKTKLINQVANLVYLEYKDNIPIRDKPPKDYWPELVKEFYRDENDIDIYKKYDLPKDFYEMDYEEFLIERRKLMANKIKNYFEAL